MAALDAMIDLIGEGHVPPSSEQVAERAQVSVASLFRYFDTVDDLRAQAAALALERYAVAFAIEPIGKGTASERIATLTDARLAQYEQLAPFGRLIRIRAPHIDAARDQLARLRATQVDQIRVHFARELQLRTPANGDDLVATIHSLTSFESWEQFRGALGRSRYQTRRAWSVALEAIVTM